MVTEIVSTKQAIGADRRAIYYLGIPRLVLMENAGRNVAEFVKAKTKVRDKIIIFAGTGYNGGDSLVAARHLFLAERKVVVYMVGNILKLKPETAVELRIIHNMAIKIKHVDKRIVGKRIIEELKGARFIIDGLLGTGAKGKLRSPLKELVEILNLVKIPKLAVDIPTGLNCDSGKVMGEAIKADYTITFKALKKGMLTPEGKRYCGKVIITEIGG
ncbi:MAG TPA: NAD(P)H-hydrate epimerase [Candidatus Omnitrophica bacterium]|nr:NAD(P)H-hydrate epimerase [Candidatus Omnitrophota bacterium]